MANKIGGKFLGEEAILELRNYMYENFSTDIEVGDLGRRVSTLETDMGSVHTQLGGLSSQLVTVKETLDHKQDTLSTILESDDDLIIGATSVYINATALTLNGSYVATHDNLPNLQPSFGEVTNTFINSNGDTSSNKCAVSAKNTTIFQSEATEGWSKGKLLFRKGRWGDDGYSTIAIPTATTTCDGVLSYSDKQIIDSIPSIKIEAGNALEIANGADTKANFLQGKITDIYNEISSLEKRISALEQIISNVSDKLDELNS